MDIRRLCMTILSVVLVFCAAGGSSYAFAPGGGSTSPGGGGGYSGGPGTTSGGGGRVDSTKDINEIVDNIYNTGGRSAVDVLESVRSGLLSLLRAVLGVGALATLVYVLYGLMNGKQEAAQKMLVWVLVLSLSFAALVVFSKTGTGVGSGTHLDGNGFNIGLVRSVLQIMLSMVSMVTLVSATIHVIGGDQEGSKKLLKWIVISAVGLSLLSMI